MSLVAAGADLEAFFPFDWSTCTLQVCSFLDGSGGGPNWWLWEFGDGNSSTEQLPTHTYADPGVYTVKLTVSNDGGTTTDSYERVIPVGNTAVVGFNRNPLVAGEELYIDWTSAFKNFEYVVGSTLAIPVMWETTEGSATFNSLPEAVCDDDDETSNQQCVIFTPEEAMGEAPTVVGAAENGVLFTMKFTKVQFRGVTDVFKGKANLRVLVDVDLDGDDVADQTNQLGTNVDVTNSGVEGDEGRLVKIISPFEGQFVGGIVPVSAGVVSASSADEVEFFVNGDSIGSDDEPNANGTFAVKWDTTLVADGPYELTAVATFGDLETTSAVRNVNVENTRPPDPDAPDGTFVTGRTSDTTGHYLTFPYELEEFEEEEEGGGGGGKGGRPKQEPSIESSATAVILDDSIEVIPGGTAPEGEPGAAASSAATRSSSTS